MSENRSQNYLHGAAILTAGVIIMKVLGAIYKIPMGNLLGDEGFAHFNVAYSIYNVFLTISTAGLPVALSRLISEANVLGRRNQIKRCFNVAMTTFFVLGTLGSLAMLLFPTELAAMMDDIEAAQSIWAMSPSVLLVCLTSAYRGYAQGHGDMRPTTISQIIEVAAKVAVGLVIARYLVSAGKGLPVASAGAIFGVTVGSLAALVYAVINKKRADKKYAATSPEPDVPDSSGRILGMLVKIAIPIVLGSCVSSLISLIDTKLVLNRLQTAAGFSFGDAKIMYGVYSKAVTLFNLPAAFVTPLTISIVPAIAACVKVRQNSEAGRIAESSLRIATIIGMPMAVGLCVLSYPIMNVLYPGSASQGPALLRVMGICSYFVCMTLMTTAVLQAQGGERLPVYAMVIGGVVKIGVNWLLVGTPSINIIGAPVGTLACYVTICVLDYIFMCRRMRGCISLGRIIIKPVISCAAMGVSAWAIYELMKKVLSGTLSQMPIRLAEGIPMLIAIIAAVGVYIIMVIATGSITMEDMKLIPKGEKLAKLIKIK